MSVAMSPEALAIIFATFAGPIFAVLATRWLDDRRQRRERQRQVFDTLMLTRRAALSPEHVTALNRIELEFASDREVMSAFRAYFDNLSDTLEAKAELPTIERFDARRRRLFADLVKLIGERHGFKVDRMDLIEGGYYPQGWEADEQARRDNTRLVNELLSNRRPMWVAVAPPANPTTQDGPKPAQQANGPFPPPPDEG